MKLVIWSVMNNIRRNVILSNRGTCVGGLQKVVQKLVEILCHNGVQMRTDEFMKTFHV